MMCALPVHLTRSPHAPPARCLQYTFTVTPLSGGANLTFTSATADVNMTGLAPATQYLVVVVGAISGGGTTPPSNTLSFVTPAAGAPTLDASPVSPYQGSVVVAPPAGGPWDSYSLVLCPVGGPAADCVQATCPAGPTPSTCPVSGLTPETSYVTTVGERGREGSGRLRDARMGTARVPGTRAALAGIMWWMGDVSWPQMLFGWP